MNKIHLFLWAFLFDISGVFSQTGCPVDYTVSQVINTATTISASNTLTANNFVNGGNDVQFTAGTSILFLPSFNIAVSGSGKFSAYIQTCQASNPIIPGPLYTASNFTKTVNTSLPVGTIAAAADVDLSGGATYTIPIAVPPGTNGVAPAIAVSYNSMGGNGILGQGWGLTGLSAISRTSKTIYHDVTANPIEFSANDRFALDGVRLVGVSGVYGANNTTYATESESFATITSYNSTFTGPGYFTVKHKSGVTYEYGNSGNSITTNAAGTQVLIWRLNKILYNDGNYIEFVYTNVNIQEIRYTGNSNTGLIPYNLIKFNYGTRPDQNTSYHAGAALPSDYLLDNITITAEGNTGFKTYQFNYGWDNINSYLNEVVEKGSDGAGLNSTIFKYGDYPSILTRYETGVTGIQDGNYVSGDFNGDGFSDILEANKMLLNNIEYCTQIRIFKSIPAVNQATTFSTPLVKGLAGNFSMLSKKSIPDLYTFLTNDFTGDGIDDIATINTSGSGASWAFNFAKIYKGSSALATLDDELTINAYTGYTRINPTTGHFLFAGDFNGDGTADLLSILGATASPSIIGIHLYLGGGDPSLLTLATTGTINIPVNIWQSADRVQVLDFNGDGKSDLMVTKDNYSEIYTFDGYYARSIYYAGFPTKYHLPFFGDFNGDRKMDILCRTSTSANEAPWYKCLSTGSTFNQSIFTFTSTPIITSSYSGDKILLMDCNGDGKTDVFHGIIGNGTATIYHTYFSRGNSFYFYVYPGVTTNLTNLNTVPLTPFDLNGDGKPELLARTNYTSYFDIIHFMPFGKELFLEKVKNGNDYNTQWTYKRMNQAGTFYSKGNVISGSVNNIQLPIQLASELKLDNGIGGATTIAYSYAEAKLHKEGKGLMGFLGFNAHNQTTGFRTLHENEFNTTYRIAAPKRITTQYVPNNSEQINQTTFTNEWLSSGVGRFFQKVNSISENKTFEGQTVSTTNTFDTYGNLTNQSVNNNGVETATTSTAYGQHGTPVPALPTSVTNSITRTGQAAYSIINTFAYNALGQLTSQVDFSDLAKSVTTNYSYNSFGNLTTTTVTPSGLSARTFSSVFEAKGRFASSNTDPLGTNTAVFDIRWGKPTSSTSIDGLTTTFTYDPFGRELTMVPPQGYSINTTYAWTNLYGARHIKSLTHPGKPDERIYYDLLDREVRTETEGWQGQWITSEKTYNAFGEPATATGPFKPGETGVLTTFNYDGYRRPTSLVENKGGTNYTSSIAYVYTGGNLTTTTTNPALQISSKITDAVGKTISTTDYGGILNYTYYSHGGLKAVINGATTLVTNSYDPYARQTNMVDINAGTTLYDYNALGQLTAQVNAKSQTHTMTYDLAGRMLTKVLPEGTTTYEYFPTGSGTSTAKIKKITGFGGDLEEYTYDTYGRPANVAQTVDGAAHIKALAYNIYDDILSVTYPSGFGLNYVYDGNGYLNTIKNGSNVTTIFSNSTMNGYNQYKTYTLGNGKTSTNSYFYGMPTSYVTTGVQNLTLNWDYSSGNLTNRVDGVVAKTESFTYDNLNRLLTSAITGQPTQSINYALNGNITSKTDAGTYAYINAKVNAVTQINPSAGNISSASQSLTAYTSYLQPASITEGSNVLNYTYGSDENRIKAVQSGSFSNTRYYFGDYEKDIIGGITKHIHYISAGDGLMAIVIRENGSDTYYYTYTDHLGSILHTTNSAGTVLSNLNFDAWGRYRNSSTWGYTSVTTPPAWLKRGFTGHEHLPLFGLINMNGRLYDPIVSRMLAVDNYIQSTEYTQSYNRYSYVFNNPLKYTDPSGEIVPLIFVGAAIIGGGLNVFSNSSKIKDFSSAFAYFISGAVGGATSVVNPLLGGSITGTANVGIDIATGNLPNLSSSEDFASYALHVGLDAFGASGVGSLAKLGGQLLNLGWRQSLKYGWTSYFSSTGQITYSKAVKEVAGYFGTLPEVTLTATKAVNGILTDGLLANEVRVAAKGGKAIVIGEGMGAVKATAQTLQSQGINAKWYQAWSKNFPTNKLMTPAELSAAQARNARWLNSKISQGYQIYDIGIDATRATRSPFYQLERSILQQSRYPTIVIPR